MPAVDCPSETLLAAFVAGELSASEWAEWEPHFASCEPCLELVSLLITESPSERAAPGAGELEPDFRSAGRFEVHERIGSGGMGVVYAGRDSLTGQRVAIKSLRVDLIAQDAGLVARFRREGEVLGRLQHPNIVQLIAVVGRGAHQYIVLEYVGGGSLRGFLRQSGRLSIELSVQLALQLARALASAHALGIVHRDLKPENVLLTEAGVARLSDFGLARVAGSTLTQQGMLLGTLSYLSPEAARDEELDERADVWALAVMVFEMLTGARPFTGRHPAALLWSIAHQPLPKLDQALPDAPPALRDLLGCMLVKERNRRIASACVVAAELEAVNASFSTTACRRVC